MENKVIYIKQVMDMSDTILKMENITKEFPGVKALDCVNFEVKHGSIHALVGENGAGKSTLMKVLSGIYPDKEYEGKLIYEGEERHFKSIKDSEKAGITIIYQELNLVKSMNVCENIFLGNEKKKNHMIQWDQEMEITRQLLKKVHLDILPTTRIEDLGVGKQQLVEIAKALGKQTKLLILDEPTASLTEKDTENLFVILKQLKQENTTCIYISHKLNEIFEIADTVTILRDGKTINTADINNLTESGMIAQMVGRELSKLYPAKRHKPQDVVMEVRDWTVSDPDNPQRNMIDQVSFTVRRGEILGISGLMGAGRTELAMSLFGIYHPKAGGRIWLDGQEIHNKTPWEAIRNGISYVSEDRKRYGLVMSSDIKENMSLASLKKLARFGAIDENKEIRRTNEKVEELNIRTPSIMQKVGNLSGGNQQKVILGKWLLTLPKVLILDEPTRGIDVGAKLEIYNIMEGLAAQGVGVVLISSEMPEILGMSDRILVMHEGKMSGEISSDEADQETLMRHAIGGK